MGVMREQRHWPTFDAVLCGQMSDRERLGLPDHYVADRFGDELHQAYSNLRKLDVLELVRTLEDASVPLVNRYAAGNLLALLGDPRIKTLDPFMIGISGGMVSIGLDADDVQPVLQRFDKLGLNESWIKKECPRHQVKLNSFNIGKYPVTNQEYKDFLIDTNYAEIPSSWAFRRFPIELANHPVYTLSAEACDAYANWLATKTGRAFRLPTEAEWEYAAAGPDAKEFPWGEAFDPLLANTCETGIFSSTSVGMFTAGASPFGVLDMAGNVEEYVADFYHAYPGGEDIDDHLSQIHGRYRVARGGSFARFRDLARNSRRHGHNPRSVTYAMGFRLAESLINQ